MDYKDIYQQYMYSYPHKTAYRKIEQSFIEQYKPLLKQQKNSLYFHIPFCESKCGYCNLFSVTGQKEDFISEYLDACQRQIEQYALQDIVFSDLTIGGGTPLLLSKEQLERLFAMAKAGFGWDVSPTIIIETAPNQTTWEKLCIMKENKVSRVSIGVQSFCQAELDRLCRHHTVKQAREAIKLLKQAMFPCLNLDFIYGIKGQTLETIRSSLEEAVSYEPDEIFIYPLYIKPGTILDRKQEKASDSRYMFYCFIRDFLCNRGYHQTSMRRFVATKAGKTEKMAASECGFENTISIGCGGRSYIGNVHFCTPYGVKQETCQRILKDYIQCQDYRQIAYGCILSEEEVRRRYVIKNLLAGRGILLREYQDRFGSDLFKDYDILQDCLEKDYLVLEGKRLHLSEEGMALSDYIGPALISKEIRQRMSEWKDTYGE
ncbi:MAG: STM4012 family radical SAM protein [Lachnospiraceae bacterium]|nr:STM4012 family radical SAM protein [Lachnospiraceae bacterium]